MFAAGKAGSAEVADAQFNYVTMLLHGDGTNGAQNNTFLDSSTNGISITRVGNTTQGTFTPYGSNWSNYVNGSSGVTVSSTSSQFGFTGDFTWEAWINLNSLPSSGGAISIICSRGTTASNSAFQFIITNSSGTYRVETTISIGSSDSGLVWNIPSTPTLGVWYHVAAVRSGSSVQAYWNGTAIGSAQTASGTTNTPTVNPSIGFRGGSYNDLFLNGYISNLRMAGSAVYTSAFTPSITSLTAISGTRLLTSQSNRFIDNSTNTFTLTPYSVPSVQRFSPFSPTTAYSTSVIGGSSYMDGTGDYLYFPNNAALSFGTGDFCVEAYVYKQRAANEPIIDSRATNNASPWALYIDGSNFPYFYDGTSYTSTIAITLNAWTHVAVTRSSGTLKIFVNGVQGYSATVTTNLDRSSGNEVIGATVVTFANPWLGYMNDFRIVKGSAVYTSAFTPPTAPLTAITNTSLLLSYTNAGILDNAMMNDLETVGNAQISTSVKKYGTGSMYFDGNGDYLVAPSSVQYAFQSGDLTIEMWVYPSAVSAVQYLIDTRDPANTASAGIQWFVSATAKFGVYVGTTAVITASTSSLSASTWTHLALVKNGSTWKIYINGTADATTGTNSTALTQGFMTIACSCNQRAATTTDKFGGYIDDLRISKVARYTANFTAPTTAFADKG